MGWGRVGWGVGGWGGGWGGWGGLSKFGVPQPGVRTGASLPLHLPDP